MFFVSPKGPCWFHQNPCYTIFHVPFLTLCFATLETQFLSKSPQILSKFLPNSSQILSSFLPNSSKFWPNSFQILTKFWQILNKILIFSKLGANSFPDSWKCSKIWPNPPQILNKFWTNSGKPHPQSLNKFWTVVVRTVLRGQNSEQILNSSEQILNKILNKFWTSLNKFWTILNKFWTNSEQILPKFWTNSGEISPDSGQILPKLCQILTKLNKKKPKQVNIFWGKTDCTFLPPQVVFEWPKGSLHYKTSFKNEFWSKFEDQKFQNCLKKVI